MVQLTDRNAAVFSAAMLLVTLFVVTNLPERFNVGVVYSLMAVFAVVVFLIVPGQGPGVEFGRKTDAGADTVFGSMIGGLWGVAATITSKTALAVAFSLGIPAPFSLVGFFDIFTTVVFAAVLETLAFEGALRKLLRFFGLGTIITTLCVATAFSLFHLYAFTRGSYAAVTSPFIAAFVFSLIAGTVALRRNNLISPMIFHSIVNAFVRFNQLS